MPPRRAQPKRTVQNGETHVTKPQERRRGATKAKQKSKTLPSELWCLIIDHWCSFPGELDYSPESFRAQAALGLPEVTSAAYETLLQQRRWAYAARRDVLLVSKAWNEMGKGQIYRTLFFSESSRKFLPQLLITFLANTNLAPKVRRIELNFDITKYSVQQISTALRGLITLCRNAEVVDDHVRRVISSKRAASPILMSMQAAGEIPFGVALAKRQRLGEEPPLPWQHMRPSRDSTAAFTVNWTIDFLARVPQIQILCLNDYPNWNKFPTPRSQNTNQPDQSNGRDGRNQHHEEDTDEEEESDDDEEHDDSEAESTDADDEEETFKPLTFEKVHTLDISRIAARDLQKAHAITKYLGGWSFPAVTQLALSIYDLNSLPLVLLKQVSSKLTAMYLHDFNIASPTHSSKEIQTEGQSRRGKGGRNKTNKSDPFAGKRVELSILTHLMVVSPTVEDWSLIFSCPSVTKYSMTFTSYSPTPYNPSSSNTEPQKRVWTSSWRHTKSHLERCCDKYVLPLLMEVHVIDCSFTDPQIPPDAEEFWTQWEEKLEARQVRLVGKEGLTWSAARATLPPRPTTSNEVEQVADEVNQSLRLDASASGPSNLRSKKTTSHTGAGASRTTESTQPAPQRGRERRTRRGQET
ncbi:hypothetical protein CPB86DRAFT_289859 [Serendipita vermifera]|nr:hypothetical protein CPB86DRAFT_289859 [Serendipita vermifera]